jgi:hypothetical protein
VRVVRLVPLVLVALLDPATGLQQRLACLLDPTSPGLTGAAIELPRPPPFEEFHLTFHEANYPQGV